MVRKASPIAWALVAQAETVRVVGPLGVEAHGDEPRRDVGDEHRDEERRDLARPALPVDVVLLLEALEAADAAADDHAGRSAGRTARPAGRHPPWPAPLPPSRTASTGRCASLPCGPCRPSGSNPFTSHANRTGKFVASNLRDSSPRPRRRRAVHATSSPRRCPTGEMAPRPVTTTRRRITQPTFSFRYSSASPTVRSFSASSSGMSMLNSFSNSITSSTMSRLSAPRSSMKLASLVSFSRSTPELLLDDVLDLLRVVRHGRAPLQRM